MGVWGLSAFLAICLGLFVAFRSVPTKTGWVGRAENPAHYWLIIALLAAGLMILVPIAVAQSLAH